jgi:hypothetical protein
VDPPESSGLFGVQRILQSPVDSLESSKLTLNDSAIYELCSGVSRDIYFGGDAARSASRGTHQGSIAMKMFDLIEVPFIPGVPGRGLRSVRELRQRSARRAAAVRRRSIFGRRMRGLSPPRRQRDDRPHRGPRIAPHLAPMGERSASSGTLAWRGLAVRGRSGLRAALERLELRRRQRANIVVWIALLLCIRRFRSTHDDSNLARDRSHEQEL